MTARCTLDPTADGRQFGFLEVPVAEASSTAGEAESRRSPVCVIRHGAGPMITFISGLHGDAPEATATLQQLAQTVNPDKLNGTLVIIPCIDVAGRGSLDQSVRSEDSDSYANRLIELITTHFINTASLVVDFSSAGDAFGFASSAAVIRKSDRELQQRAEAYMIAFGAPNSVRFPDAYASRLDRACDNADVPCIRLLLGGHGTCSTEVLEIAWRGCQNLFSHSGLIDQELVLCSTRMLEVRDDHADVHASRAGLYCCTARLGGELWRGDMLIHIYDPASFTAKPVQLSVPRDRIVLGMRRSGACMPDERLMLLADEVQC